MSTQAFDTLEFAQELIQSGMPEKQAQTLARSQAKLIQEQLATKQDLRELEYRLTLRLGSMMVVAIGIVATLVKIL